jgi:hypothetical protein
MEGYISGISAAIIWDIPCIETVIGRKISEIDETDITVTKYNARFRQNGKKVHASESLLPPGAVVIKDGKRIASPELLFLELAGKLSIHRLILLGLQLCSHQSGSTSLSITTTQKLREFLAKTKGHRGQYNAVRALKYVKEGSASIMESLAYMILGLPNALGGYGLKGAVFNHEIKLKGEAALSLGQDHCYVDLYYKREKVGVEYQSLVYHSSPAEQGKDAKRAAILERKGINVMFFTTIQLYERAACRDFAHTLATRLGRRIEIRTKKFDEMHTMLRELLPSYTNGT